MKKYFSTLLIATVVLSACAGVKSKTRTVLDSVSGAIIVTNSFMDLAERSLSLKDEKTMDAWIRAKDYLLVALEYIDTAYELSKTTPDEAQRYAACSLENLSQALAFARKAGVVVPGGLENTITAVEKELGGVTCGKPL